LINPAYYLGESDFRESLSKLKGAFMWPGHGGVKLSCARGDPGHFSRKLSASHGRRLPKVSAAIPGRGRPSSALVREETGAAGGRASVGARPTAVGPQLGSALGLSS